MQRQVEMWVAVYDVGDAASNLRLDRSSAWRDDPLNVDPPAQVRHTATHCNTLQHTATQLHILRLRRGTYIQSRCSLLQGRAATHYNTLPHIRHFNTLQFLHCKALQNTRISPQQGTARHCKEVQGSARKCKEVQGSAALQRN